MSSFSVVEFLDEGTVETIPTEWVTPTKQNALWPELRNYSKVKKLLKGDFNLSEGQWKKVAIRVMGSADTYFSAKVIEQKVEYTSTYESDFEKLPRKRTIKKRQLTSDSEDDTPLYKPKRIPPFPGSKNNCQKSVVVVDESSLDLETEQCLDVLQGSFSRYEEDVPSRTPFENSSSTTKFMDNKCLPQNMNFNEALQARLFRALGDISFEVKQLRKDVGILQNQILAITKNDGNVPQESGIEFLPLPINSAEDLLEIEEFIKSQTNFTNMVNFLNKLGGSSVRDLTYNCMRKVFGGDVACDYSLYGRKGKKAFNQLLIYKAILSAVKMTTNCTDEEINKRMGLYLAGAKDRNGGRKERMKIIN